MTCSFSENVPAILDMQVETDESPEALVTFDYAEAENWVMVGAGISSF